MGRIPSADSIDHYIDAEVERICESARWNDPAQINDVNGLSCRSASRPHADSQLKFLRTRLGRIIRDIRRKIEGDPVLEDRFGPLLDLAVRVRHQEQRQRGPKVYSLHAPEVECIGKGKARAPY
jgi:hypothetical protein